MSNIRDLVRQLAAAPESDAGSLILGQVSSVDEVARTIDVEPLDESAPILGVNLQANQNSEVGMVLFPRMGSYVIVGMLGMCQAVVLACDDVERVRVDVDKMSLDISKDGIVLNGGDLGGLVLIEKLTEKINGLVDTVNALATAFDAHTHVGNMGSPTAPPTSLFGQQADKFNRSDYENNYVKQ